MSRLSEALRLYCSINRIGIRQLSEESGVDKAAISRWWNDKAIEARQYIKLMEWLNGSDSPAPQAKGDEE